VLSLFVDSSVWIDYFNGVSTSETDYLDDTLGKRVIVVGDLILAEVLQGFRFQKDFEKARNALLSFPLIEVLGTDIAIKSAVNYRKLRTKGITIRKTIDCLIATRCIEDGLTLLHSDRDFDQFEQHLALKVQHP
jgi:predicted nucleic acid-binding protein